LRKVCHLTDSGKEVSYELGVSDMGKRRCGCNNSRCSRRSQNIEFRIQNNQRVANSN